LLSAVQAALAVAAAAGAAAAASAAAAVAREPRAAALFREEGREAAAQLSCSGSLIPRACSLELLHPVDFGFRSISCSRPSKHAVHGGDRDRKDE
jgi:hypothetical protein